jgi:mono/diheme cytochrome c family protein
MRKFRSSCLARRAILSIALAAGIVQGAPASKAQQVASDPASGLDWKQGVVNKYCLGCHNAKLKTAGVVLEGLDITQAPRDAAVWERVLRKVRTAEMPPRGLPRPTPEQYTAFAKSLEDTLDSAAVAHPEPGRPGVHRLNRTEYSNAVRDLLALDIQAGASLPADNTGYGFDNIADVLSTSPVLLERYISVARSVSRQAVGDPKLKPSKDRFEPVHETSAAAKGRNERIGDELPFDSRGGIEFKRYFPLDAEYVIEVKMAPDPQVAAAEGIDKPVVNELRLPLKAGLHTIGVTFPRDSSMPEVETPVPVRRAGGGKNAKVLTSNMDLWLDSARLKTFEVAHASANPEIANVIVGGPYNVAGRGETPSRAKIFVCRPTASTAEDPCARKILTNLAHHAFRRPVTDADITPLLAFYRNGRKLGDFDDGIEKALEAMLVSPDFLFRVEQDPGGLKASSVYQLSDIDLASRLSFFLWSSIPDDQLLTLAEQHKLKDPKVMEQQVQRMLADSRSQALIINFAGQWLDLRNLATWRPDAGLFPQFDESLRRSMQQQTELFFESVVRENRSMLDLLDADYTYLNQRLAEHYGIDGIYGPQFRRVTLADTNRQGLLGQASILTVTSYPSRTSVVQRGKWVLENMLGTPPPPPPPDVPAFPSASKDGKQMTTRQAMVMHRANAVCASCHARMEPIGFALENYDAIGRWRSEDAGLPLDVSGKLPDGSEFTGPNQLSKLLASKYKEDFVSTVTEKLLIYALGRGLEYYDKPTVRSITRRAASDNYTMNSLVLAIVNSTPFQMRRSLEHNDTDE